MKRKCYALLALLLAVCMVLPMGVFVGADTPATGTGATETPKLTLKVSNSIKTDGSPAETLTDPTDVYVAVEGTPLTISATLDKSTGYTIEYEETSTSSKGAILVEGSKGNYTVTGISTRNQNEAVATIKFNVKNDKTVVTSKSINIHVVKPSVYKMEVYLEKTGLLSDKASFDPGFEFKVSKLKLYFSDKDAKEVSPSDGVLKYYVNDNKVDNTVVLHGGDNKVKITFTYRNYAEVVNEYNITVKGQEISVKIEKNIVRQYNERFEKFTALENAIRENIKVNVYNQEKLTAEAKNYSLFVQQKGSNTNISTISASVAELANYTFYVEFEGVRSEIMNVGDVITLKDDRKVEAISMDITGIYTKEFYDGNVLNDFRGVVVTISYDSGDPDIIRDKDIENLKLQISPFVYGQDYIVVEYATKKTIVDLSGIVKVLQKEVKEIVAETSSQFKKIYKAGQTLDLTGLQIRLKFNDASAKDELIKYNDSRITCYPAHGEVLSTSNTEVVIHYKGGIINGVENEKVISVPIKVNAEGAKIMDAYLSVSSFNGKKEYFVGESFEPDNYKIVVVTNDEKNPKITYALKSLSNVQYSWAGNEFSTAKPKFNDPYTGNLIVRVTLTGYSGSADVEIPITVTKRPNLKSISANFTKKDGRVYAEGYYVGDVPSVLDFSYSVVYDDGSSRSFPVSETDSGYKSTAPYSYTKTDENGIVYYTLKLTPSKIDEETKSIRITYTERVTLNGKTTTDTVYTDVEIKVSIPDCILKHYTSYRNYETTPYESIHDALDHVEDGDEIQLCRDVTLTGDEPQSKSFEIDLNGHTLTMVRGEIYVRSNASSTTKITFSNSSRDDAHIRYTNNEDDDVIVAYNKEYVIDRNSKGDGRYDVTITSVKNGKVTGPTEVIHGHDAKFTITPDEGYEIASIKVNNKTYKAASDNTLLIEDVREKLTVTVTFQEKEWQNPFTDVSKYATYYKAVQFVYEEGLFNGTSATKFEPDTTMTRAMFVTVLGRLAGVNVDNYKTSSFSDVATGQWYSEYVEWASSIGLVEGYGNGKFGPNDSITHAQMYVLMERYADIIEGKNTAASGTSISANDVRDIPDWAYEAVEYAAKKDFLVVSSYKLTPNDNAKRSELAMLLQKFCKNVLGY